MNTDFYSVLTDEYFKNYLNRERFIWDSKQWIYNVYYALYKTSKSIESTKNIVISKLKIMIRIAYFLLRFPNFQFYWTRLF